jgi:hypothetical protein
MARYAQRVIRLQDGLVVEDQPVMATGWCQRQWRAPVGVIGGEEGQ